MLIAVLVYIILTSASATQHPPGAIGAHAGASGCAAHDSIVVNIAGAVDIPTSVARAGDAVALPGTIAACTRAGSKLAGDAGAVGQPVAGVRVVTGGLHWWGWSTAGAAASTLRQRAPEHG
jgi:hypothetical protein